MIRFRAIGTLIYFMRLIVKCLFKILIKILKILKFKIFILKTAFKNINQTQQNVNLGFSHKCCKVFLKKAQIWLQTLERSKVTEWWGEKVVILLRSGVWSHV